MVDELELGRRVASRIGNEQDGFGAWIDPGIFEINLHPVVLQSDWTRDVEGTDPYYLRSPKRSSARPIFFPAQREPSEPQTKRR